MLSRNLVQSILDEFEPRPPSEQLSELHVYLVPREKWVENRKLAKREVTEFSISSGFVRVVPHCTLSDLRREIYRQLGYDVVPKNYVFLRSVGRNFTQVKPTQEMEMKVKNYLPPYASEPEIYLKEGLYTGAYSWTHAGDDSGLEESVTESNSQPSREDIPSPDSFDDNEKIVTTDVFMSPRDTGTQSGIIRTDMAITMATANNTDTDRKRRNRRHAKNAVEREQWTTKRSTQTNDSAAAGGDLYEDFNELSQAIKSYRRRKIYQKGSIVNGGDSTWLDWREESRFRKDYAKIDDDGGGEERLSRTMHQKRDRSLDTLSRIPITVGPGRNSGTVNTKMRAAKSMSSLPVKVKEGKNIPNHAGGNEKRKIGARRRKTDKKDDSLVVIENTSIRLVDEDGKPQTNGAEMVQYVQHAPTTQEDQIVRHHVLLLEGEEDGGTVSDAAAETIRQVQAELGRSRDGEKPELVEVIPEIKEDVYKSESQEMKAIEGSEDKGENKETKDESNEESKEAQRLSVEEVMKSYQEPPPEEKTKSVPEEATKVSKDDKNNEKAEKKERSDKRERSESKSRADMEIKLPKSEDFLEHHLASGETLQSLSRDGRLQIEVLVKELMDAENDATIDGGSRDANRVGRTNRFGYDLNKIRKPVREPGRYGRIVYSPGNIRRSRSDGYGLASKDKMPPETPAAEKSHRQRLMGTGQWLSSVDLRGHEYYITERERLLLLLDRLRSELRLCETRRDELLRRIKHLQNRANHRRDQVRELWRKRYLDAKKITPKLEEECSKMRQELEKLHRELLAKVQAGVAAILVASGKVEKPSNKLSYKIMIARLLQEIEDLRRRVEGTRLKLSAEIKLRIQAEKDVKALREELLKKKIQVTLTRHQEQAALGSNIREQYFISTV